MRKDDDLWENILLSNNYHLAYAYGLNRYYVANEHTELDDRFLPIQQLKQLYDITYVD